MAKTYSEESNLIYEKAQEIEEKGLDKYGNQESYNNFIKEAISKADHDLDSSPKAKKQVARLVEKKISEYTSYIKFAIEINPFDLKVIKTLRNSKQFWIDWRDENLA